MISLMTIVAIQFEDSTMPVVPWDSHPERTPNNSYVLDKKVLVEKIATTHQRADIFTKALPRDAFRYLRRTIIGW